MLRFPNKNRLRSPDGTSGRSAVNCRGIGSGLNFDAFTSNIVTMFQTAILACITGTIQQTPNSNPLTTG